MAYKVSDAVSELKGLSWMTREVGGEPLSGIYDGTNRVFRTVSYPIATDPPLSLLNASGQLTTGYSVDAPTGKVTFVTGTTGPMQALYADYTIQQISDTKLTTLCKRGFDEMETRVRRGWYLYATGSEFYISSDQDGVTDPQVGGTTFSQSRTQIDFFLGCCELKLYESMTAEATRDGIAYREERVGGLSVDASKKSKDWQTLLAQHRDELTKKEEAARYESGIGDEYGDFIPGPRLVDGVWYGYGEEA